MTRIYLPITLNVGSDVTLPSDTVHRLRDVQRAAPGHQITVFNGQGGEYRAVIRELTRNNGVIQIEQFAAVSRETPLNITLAQGLARGEKMDYTMQKAVELGVHRIVPIATLRSQVKLDAARAAKRREHWQALVINACEQCGRNVIPQVTEVMPAATFIAHDGAALRLTLSPHAEQDLTRLHKKYLSPTTISLVIGPEGGLDPREEELLAGNSYHRVRLGPRVLRTETAALVALSALQTLWGDLASEPPTNFG